MGGWEHLPPTLTKVLRKNFSSTADEHLPHARSFEESKKLILIEQVFPVSKRLELFYSTI